MSDTISAADLRVGDHFEWIPGTDITVTAVEHDYGIVRIEYVYPDGSGTYSDPTFPTRMNFAGHAKMTRLSTQGPR